MSLPFLTGIWVGLMHVISGPDHLATIAPLVLERKKNLWKIGLFWGLGHLLGMVLIGILFYIFKSLIPLEEISEISEHLVGIVLIFIGFWSLLRNPSKEHLRKNKHIHSHSHISSGKEVVHIHKHTHKQDEVTHGDNHRHGSGRLGLLYPSFATGVIHGFAGVAHFVFLLPVLGFKDQFGAILFIVGFSVGSIVSMMLVAQMIGVLKTITNTKSRNLSLQHIRIIAGIFAIGLGFYWLLN